MSRGAAKPCPVHGCPELKPCPTHARTHGWDSSRRKEHRAGSGWAEAAAAKRVLRRDGHRCYLRLPGICIGVATEVDHPIPLAEGGSDNDSNRRAICRPCHKAKTEREKQAGRARSRGQSC